LHYDAAGTLVRNNRTGAEYVGEPRQAIDDAWAELLARASPLPNIS